MKGFLFGTLEARRNAELEKLRECMHCEDSERFRERVERREDWEKPDLDDGAASLENDLVSLWRRDNRVNRRMACPRDGIVDDILRERQLQLQILTDAGATRPKQIYLEKEICSPRPIPLGKRTKIYPDLHPHLILTNTMPPLHSHLASRVFKRSGIRSQLTKNALTYLGKNQQSQHILSNSKA